MPKGSLAPISGVAATLGMLPGSALAASGRSFEQVVYVFLAVSAVLLVLWAAYYFSPVHRHFIRRDSDYKRVLLPLLGLVAIAFGTTAVITGQVYLPGGSSVIREQEAKLFWRYVALQFGAGVALIVLGLLYPARRS